MRGVALALKQRGNTVTGTDENAYAPGDAWLDEHGIDWWREADAAHLDGVDVLVVGGGTATDNPELLEAQKRGLKLSSYPEVVGELTADARRIVVAGTHGKTTTTSLIAWLLESAGRKPDFVVGIQPNNFDSSVRAESGELAVLEGDEYRASSIDDHSKFYYYHPDVAVITTIEHDHPDMFKDLEAIKARFKELVKGMPQTGHLYIWNGSQTATDVAVESGAPISTYGTGGQWRAAKPNYGNGGISFELHHHGESLGKLEVPMYGEHNIWNATAAAAVVLGEGVEFEQLAAGMAAFKGASRRFERVSRANAPITVIDDYAHHPTEVRATIAAARAHFSGRVIAIFRPHTFSRTAALLDDYRQAFKEADQTFIAPIEGAREAGEAGKVNGADLVSGESMHYVEDRGKLVADVVADARPGDVVLCMTVNGYDGLAHEIADKTA